MTDLYKDADNFSDLPQQKIGSICAYCYSNGKFVIVKNEGLWQPVAGHVDPGEKPEEALIREVKEESNMKVLKYFPLGYYSYYKKDEQEPDFYQTRYLCLVEPYGPFIKDPCGDVSEIKLVDFQDILKYVIPEDISNVTLSRCKEVLDSLKIDKKV